MAREICNNCDGWREEHYMRGGGWNEEGTCQEYVGRDATADELKHRDADLHRYELWLTKGRKAGVASVAPWRKS